MTKRQDLCLQRRPRSEQSDRRQPDQAANISHQPRASLNSTSLASRIEFSDSDSSLFVALPWSQPGISKSASKRSGPASPASFCLTSAVARRTATQDLRAAASRAAATPITTSCRVVISKLPVPIQQRRSATGSIANILGSLISNGGKLFRRNRQKVRTNSSGQIWKESVNRSGHRSYCCPETHLPWPHNSRPIGQNRCAAMITHWLAAGRNFRRL